MHHETEKISWIPACPFDDILPDTGVCALLNDRHVALFRLKGEEKRVFALDNIDPNCGASVLSRGLVGNLETRLVVASPIYKHHFDLQTGECLEAPENSVNTYRVKLEGDFVWIAE